MLYVIVACENPEEVLLVQAESEKEIRERLDVREEEVILGGFSDNDLEVLKDGSFVVISS